MPGLALKLAPREQVLINGVIVENGPRRAQIVIRSEDAAILRLREALDESQVIGPASRAYFAAQRALEGRGGGPRETGEALDALAAHLGGAAALRTIEEARQACAGGNFYRAMRSLKPLVGEEREGARLA